MRDNSTWILRRRRKGALETLRSKRRNGWRDKGQMEKDTEGYRQTEKNGHGCGGTYKQFDVTPCIRLVALLIAQEAHFYPSRDISAPLGFVDHLCVFYLLYPSLLKYIWWNRRHSQRGGYYIQSRLISGSFFSPPFFLFWKCDFRFKQFEWDNLIALLVSTLNLFNLQNTKFWMGAKEKLWMYLFLKCKKNIYYRKIIR